ncbi:MAG TPA: hypothetical protein VH478_16315 [Trebonia sp.]|jgi:hypothetical protein|nr:hypothetical protein [Trebonia sp.]
MVTENSARPSDGKTASTIARYEEETSAQATRSRRSARRSPAAPGSGVIPARSWSTTLLLTRAYSSSAPMAGPVSPRA